MIHRCPSCGSRLCSKCGEHACSATGSSRCLQCANANGVRARFTPAEDRLIRRVYASAWCRGICFALAEVLPGRSPGTIRNRARRYLRISQRRGAPYGTCAGCNTPTGDRPHLLFRDHGIYVICTACVPKFAEEGAA